jgi:hypothetical protein
MATGPEMLINTLVKAFKLEPEVDKIKAAIRQASDENLIGQAREALEKVGSFDARLARIEQALGIRCEIVPNSGSDAFERTAGLLPVHSPQLKNGTDN